MGNICCNNRRHTEELDSLSDNTQMLGKPLKHNSNISTPTKDHSTPLKSIDADTSILSETSLPDNQDNTAIVEPYSPAGKRNQLQSSLGLSPETPASLLVTRADEEFLRAELDQVSRRIHELVERQSKQGNVSTDDLFELSAIIEQADEAITENGVDCSVLPDIHEKIIENTYKMDSVQSTPISTPFIRSRSQARDV